MFSTAKYLEGIAGFQVDGGRTPYLRLRTESSAKHVHCLAEYIITLRVEGNTRMTLGNRNFSCFVLLNLVEDGEFTLAVDYRLIDVDNHITMDMTCVVASAIDVTTQQSAVLIGGCQCTRS